MENVVKLEVGVWEVVVIESVSGPFFLMLGLAGWPSKVLRMFLEVVARSRGGEGVHCLAFGIHSATREHSARSPLRRQW